jgi:hypothetical protein
MDLWGVQLDEAQAAVYRSKWAALPPLRAVQCRGRLAGGRLCCVCVRWWWGGLLPPPLLRP